MDEQVQIMPATVARDLTASDLLAALAAGWGDFRAHTTLGLFVAAFYVVAGMFLYFILFNQGEITWMISIAAGYPLIAPYSAVGLYEVSRRREVGLS